jgi:choline-glycine betaine transporter
MMAHHIDGAIMKLSRPTYLKIVRASACYDLLLTAPFATPWTFTLAHARLSAINQWLGGAALPAFSAFHVLFACLMGSVVLVWSVLRLRMADVRLGPYDGAARFLFASWMGWALAATGAPLLWLFVVPEFAWGVAQWLPVANPDQLCSSTARAPFTSAAPMRSSRGG